MPMPDETSNTSSGLESLSEMDAYLRGALADYAAPIADDGFTAALMTRLDGQKRRSWTGPLIALCLGGVAATALRLALPSLPSLPSRDIPVSGAMPQSLPDLTAVSSASPALYIGGLVCLVMLWWVIDDHAFG